MLSDSKALEEVLFGPEGASEALVDQMLIDMSTVGPDTVHALRSRVA